MPPTAGRGRARQSDPTPAPTPALQSVAMLLLDEQEHRVHHAITTGGDEAQEKIAEESAAIARLLCT
jgi:hypothetical protein